jgi:hypothetical protein
MGACEKVKSEMVVSNPWVWGIFPWYLGYNWELII